jgi:hypothetical protein
LKRKAFHREVKGLFSWCSTQVRGSSPNLQEKVGVIAAAAGRAFDDIDLVVDASARLVPSGPDERSMASTDTAVRRTRTAGKGTLDEGSKSTVAGGETGLSFVFQIEIRRVR